MFAAAIVQVSVVAQIGLVGGTPDVLLVTLVGVALLRGSITGAVGGFFAGLLLDTARLGTLGLSSLLLTVAGYWIGRYGETTGRDRTHAPLVSVAVITMLYAIGGLLLRSLLGEDVDARLALVDALPATILLNALLTPPLYALCRRLLPPDERRERSGLVRLLG